MQLLSLKEKWYEIQNKNHNYCLLVKRNLLIEIYIEFHSISVIIKLIIYLYIKMDYFFDK